MSQTNQEKLDEMYEMIQENNEILRSLLRRERIANFMRILYWLFIIGTLLGVYYYAQPYMLKITENFSSLQNAITNVNNNLNTVGGQLPETKAIRNFLDVIKSFFNK